MIITYGDFTVDFTKLPEKSVVAMLRRGVAHYLGNEMASKVAAKFDGVEATDEQKAAAKAEFQAAALEALQAGTVGDSTRGPRGSAIDTIIRRIARTEIEAVLAGVKGADGKSLKFPTGDKTVTLGDQNLTGNDLIERRLVKHGDRIRKEAEAEMKRQAKTLANAGDASELLG